jgi:hypothetical protein
MLEAYTKEYFIIAIVGSKLCGQGLFSANQEYQKVSFI